MTRTTRIIVKSVFVFVSIVKSGGNRKKIVGTSVDMICDLKRIIIYKKNVDTTSTDYIERAYFHPHEHVCTSGMNNFGK